jgi:cytidine deaminase
VAIIALMMEAARTSETLVNFYQTTRCYNPEDSHLQFIILFISEDNHITVNLIHVAYVHMANFLPLAFSPFL